jgi:tRNA(Phe) wybutosine-synthesizing methylase Tyw3
MEGEINIPSKIKQRGKNSYLLTVKHDQQEYIQTVKNVSRSEANDLWKLFAAEILQGKALISGTERMTLTEFYQY